MAVKRPATVEDAVGLLAEPGVRIIAGGTDLLPNLKHGLDAPVALVSLSQLTALRAVVRDEAAGVLRIGAGVTLAALHCHSDVAQTFPSLAKAAGLVASPLIRNMGTLGGNVNLDTRCRYVNQTAFWRQAIGGCLKAEGTVCHVVPGGRNCVAAISSDCVPTLIALDATFVLTRVSGCREVPAGDYFCANGLRHTERDDDELMTEVVIPLPRGPRRSDYVKWTVRKSIDFPLLSIALRFDLAAETIASPVTDIRVVVGVLGAKPRRITRLEGAMGGCLTDPDFARKIAQRVQAQCKPLENVPYDAQYRRDMLGVWTRRAIESLAEDTCAYP